MRCVEHSSDKSSPSIKLGVLVITLLIATGCANISVNPVEASHSYDALDRFSGVVRFHYYWNGENRLVCASNSECVVTYAYDHRGRMVTKTLCASAPLRLIKITTYLWDNWNIIREIVREGDSVAVTDNIWGLDLDGTLQGAGGVGGLLAVQRSDCAVTNSAFCILHSALYFPTYDANGNISEYVSDSGEIIAHYDYSPFGEPLVASGELAASFSFTHQFSTKPYCPVTELSEYQMRKFRPEIGRWMSRDPMGEVDFIHISTHNVETVYLTPNASYLFVLNSTQNTYDINGAIAHWVLECGVGCAAGAAAGLIGSIGDMIRGDWRGAACGAVGGAVTGCCQTLICANVPNLCLWGSCICAGIGNLVEQSCKGKLDLSKPCSLLTFLASGAIGCLSGSIADSTEYYLKIVAFLTGLDVSAITSMCDIGK